MNFTPIRPSAIFRSVSIKHQENFSKVYIPHYLSFILFFLKTDNGSDKSNSEMSDEEDISLNLNITDDSNASEKEEEDDDDDDYGEVQEYYTDKEWEKMYSSTQK